MNSFFHSREWLLWPLTKNFKLERQHLTCWFFKISFYSVPLDRIFYEINYRGIWHGPSERARAYAVKMFILVQRKDKFACANRYNCRMFYATQRKSGKIITFAYFSGRKYTLVKSMYYHHSLWSLCYAVTYLCCRALLEVVFSLFSSFQLIKLYAIIAALMCCKSKWCEIYICLN